MYEKLPNFCFLCGILGHEEVNCPKIYVDNFIEPDGELSYGNWMRVNGVEIYRASGGSQASGLQLGSDIFAVTANEACYPSRKENTNPNLGHHTFRGGWGCHAVAP